MNVVEQYQSHTLCNTQLAYLPIFTQSSLNNGLQSIIIINSPAVTLLPDVTKKEYNITAYLEN